MSFNVGRLAATVFVVSLLVEMQISQIGHAAFRAKIAFTCVGVDLTRDICVMDADGGNEERLTEDPGYDAEPSWSPDGNRIAFNRGHHIYVMDSDGQNLMQLTERFTDREPAWSPDGVRIAFVSAKRHGGPEIYAMDSDGNNQVRITHDLRPKDNPSWSPDGQWIAYDESLRGWLSQIYVVEADGGGRKKRLTHDAPHKRRPAWSPDGDTIAYALRVPAVRTTIHLMTANGDYLKQLSGEHGGDDTGPDWFDPVGLCLQPQTTSLSGARLKSQHRVVDELLRA